ncbi:MAG: trigger factor [Ruminococcus sp.]|jgi:trigger factor|nr:trigger factor [Ruminococcus sp.]
MELKSCTKTTDTTYELVFSVGSEIFKEELKKTYNKEKKRYRIDGFRPGKATQKMIEAQYGPFVFYESTVNNILSDNMPKALEESEIDKSKVLDVPDVDVTGNPIDFLIKGIEFKAVYTIMPEIEVSEYKGIKAPRKVKEVTDKDVEDMINASVEKDAEIVSASDRPVRLGDTVKIDFVGKKDGEAFDGGSSKDFELEIGSGQFIPGFEEQIIGHSVDETFDIEVTFPESYHSESLAGQLAVFTITLNEIYYKDYPELTDEYVSDHFESETVAEYKEKVRKRIEEQAENSADAEFENYVFEKVIENVSGEIPQILYDKRVNVLVRELDYRYRQIGSSLDAYLNYTGQEIEDLKVSFQKRAREEVKLRLALEKIAEIENLTVTDEEYEAELKSISESSNTSVEDVKKFISENDVRSEISTRKAYDFVKESAVVDNTIEVEEESQSEPDTADMLGYLDNLIDQADYESLEENKNEENE